MADDNDNESDTNTNTAPALPPLLVSQFQAFTGTTDAKVARQYLEMSGNHLETAVSLFVEMNDGGDNISSNISSRSVAEEEEEEERGKEYQATIPSDANGGDQDQADDLGNSANNDNVVDVIDDVENISLDFSEPDYDYLADDNDDDDGDQSDASSDVPSSPDYDHLDFEEPSASVTYQHIGGAGEGSGEGVGIEQNHYEDVARTTTYSNEHNDVTGTKETGDDECIYYAEVEDIGEEYILGTLMVRVLQAKNLKSNPHNEGGGIGGLLSKHRRFRHHKSTMSPISGGTLTPSSYYKSPEQQLYADVSFEDQSQVTSVAAEHSHGDYHWSRGDQSYFDVTCPSFPLRMGKIMQQSQSKSKLTSEAAAGAVSAASSQKDASCAKPNSHTQQHHGSSTRRPPPPILQLSLYSKKPGTSPKQKMWPPYMHKNNGSEKNDDHLIGKCSINVLRILSGKTPYFDEWCTLRNDNDNLQNNLNSDESSAGRVRIVIEYEPTDPPPRPGDTCVFANIYPLAEELYPVPLHLIRNNTVRSVRSSMSVSTLSSSSADASSSKYSSSYNNNNMPSLTCLPKKYRVEEVVGDHVVLSYQTPVENWQCTFEVHRYLLLCVERHQASVEKYRERVLDLCDNLSQSPAVHTITKTVETLPDEGLVYVGADMVGGGVSLLGRWWEVGVEGMVEDVVDGINLDGRYSHLSDDEAEEDDNDGTDLTNVQSQSSEALPDERKALPGMPCCPITGLPMVEPVVAADGHTYECHAIARWLQTSNRSPLTGEMLAHAELVPNYLLLSSLGNEVQRDEDGGEDVVEF